VGAGGGGTWGKYGLEASGRRGLAIVTTDLNAFASGVIAAGMSWWKGMLTVSLGNLTSGWSR